MKLRDYQRNAVQAVRKVWDGGDNNALIVIPTGGGKTIIFTVLGKELRLEGLQKILVLAHRTELVQQALDKWKKVDPTEAIGIYQGNRRDLWADVICASVQSCYPDTYVGDPCPACRRSIQRKDKASPTGLTQVWVKGPGCGDCGGLGETRRLKRRGRIHELPLAQIDLVIIDEAHHITPGSIYDHILQAIRAVNPNCFHLGVTATPVRMDNKGFGWLYKGVAFSLSIQKLIDDGHLVPVRGVRVELDLDLTDVRVSKASGDFNDDDLGEVMDTADARREIVRAWQQHAGPGVDPDHPAGRLTAAFCPTVAAAEHLCAEFVEAGILAEWLCGETDPDERAAILRRFGRQEIRVLVNVGVLTEGWDEPATSCILIARPTKSKALFIQIVGRGTRLMGLTIDESIRNGKRDCLVIDTTGATNLGLATLADLSAIPEPKPEEAEDEEPADGLEPQPEISFPDEPKTIKITGHSSYEVDLFGGRVHWAKINGARVANMGPGRTVVVFGAAGKFSALETGMGAGIRWITKDQPEVETLKAAEIHALQQGQDKFLQPGAWFTRKPATDRQRAFLRQLLKWSRRYGRIDLADSEVDAMSMALASSWAGYLAARIEFGKAAQGGVVRLVSPALEEVTEADL